MSVRHGWLLALCVVVVSGVGCAAQPAGPGMSCASNDECESGLCRDGRCVERPDAGSSPTDSGTPRDATLPELDGAPPELDAGLDGGSPPPDASFDPFGDSDGDGISDFHEGRTSVDGAGSPDTDGDGTADYLDLDSDGDGISDTIEAGDASVTTSPIDSDFDGVADYRDLDSDGNGVPDAIEGAGDADGDSRPAFRDVDNDEDGLDDVSEIGADPSRPRDTNSDGTPDYDSPDSDGDTIHDATEGLIDTDADGVFDIYDLDTDDDGFIDSVEAGDADVGTAPIDTDADGIADFRDPDSDGDGLSDSAERTAGTSRTSADTDGDGVTDLIEVGAGTDPLSASDSPRTRGDFVFVVPYMMPPSPTRDTLQFATSLQKADVYFMMDNTGSMGGTIAALQSGLTSTVIPDIRSRIPDAWFGVGGFDDYPLSAYSYGSSGCGTDTAGIAHDAPFFQYQTMTMSDTAAQTAVNRYRTNCGYDGPESAVAALYSLVSRNNLGGYARFMSSGSTPPSCPAGYRGAACFRPDAVPIVIVMTDVDQHNSPTCSPSFWGTYACDYRYIAGAPSWTAMTGALSGMDVRAVGISTSTYGRAFLERLVTDTTLARGAPGPASSYVLDAPSGSGLSAAVTDAVRRAALVPLDVSARASDVVDPGDTVDAVAAFLDRLETRTSAAPGLTCTTGLATSDRPGIDGDTYPDTFDNVTPGLPVCFDIVPKTNVTVMPTLDPQLFRARIDVLGDGFTPLDDRIIFFLVPPRVPDPNER